MFNFLVSRINTARGTDLAFHRNPESKFFTRPQLQPNKCPSQKQGSFGNNDRPTGDFNPVASHARLYSARPSHLITLLDHYPGAFRNESPRREQGRQRAGGASGRRILGDTDAREKRPGVGGGTWFARFETEEITTMAAQRAGERDQFFSIHPNALQGDQTSHWNQQMHGPGGDRLRIQTFDLRI